MAIVELQYVKGGCGRIERVELVPKAFHDCLKIAFLLSIPFRPSGFGFRPAFFPGISSCFERSRCKTTGKACRSRRRIDCHKEFVN